MRFMGCMLLCFLTATPAWSLQCGLYTIEGETTKKVRVDGKLQTQRHYLPLPDALSIHSGNIGKLRIAGVASDARLALQWRDQSGNTIFTETLPLTDGVTQDYRIVDLLEERLSQTASVTFTPQSGGADLCHASARIKSAD